MSGSVLGVAVIAATVCTAGALVPVVGIAELRVRLDGAADASALAAADVASGALPGVPCDEAARVANSDRVRLSDCRVDGAVATVTVEGDFVGAVASARATAGPPGTSGE